MEIKNDLKERKNSFYTKSVQNYKNRLKNKTIYLVFMLFIIIFFFGAASFFYGVHMYYTGRYYPIRMLAYRIVQGDFSFIKNKSISTYAEIDNFKIDIKFSDLEKLRYLREKAVKQKYISDDLQEEIPAKIMYKNKSYKVWISLTGLIVEHFQHPEKWSLSIKIKGDNTLLGMKEFALLVPTSRGYLTDWTAHKILKSRDVVGSRCDFIDVDINGKNTGIYYLEERFDKLLIENNKFREGIIFKVVGTNLEVYNEKKIRSNPETLDKLYELNKLWYSFLSGNVKSEQLFDLKKLASTAVVSDLMNQKHPLYFSNMRFYFNPITGLIEPIAREWGFLTKESKMPFEALFIEDPDSRDASPYHKGLHDDALIMKIYNNPEFDEYYLKEADLISSKNYLDSIMSATQEERNFLMGKIYKENPFYEYPINILYKKQKFIREKIRSVSPQIEAVYKGIENDSIVIRIENKDDLPVEIRYLTYNSKKMIYPARRMLIKANYKADNSDQIFKFHFKNGLKADEFSYVNLMVHYNVLGINDPKKAVVLSKKMSENDYKNINPMTAPQNIREFSFLDINDSTKSIEFSEEICVIEKDMFIPEGYNVAAKPGCRIDLVNSSKIICYSPLLFFGEKDKMIEIFSSDSTGQGIIILNCDRTSELSFVLIKNLSNPTQGKGDITTGSITFYESPVNINRCIFEDNLRGDDFINIVRTEFNLMNSTFRNINADALDSDFSKGVIEGVNFYNTGNDGIDVSGTELECNNVFFDNIGDKGISIGEKSRAYINRVEIKNSEIAVCSKDMSEIIASDIKFSNCRIGFSAFQKKPEFGPSKIKAKNIKTENIEIEYLIETNSICEIDGVFIETNNEKVKDIFYGVIYGKASK